MAYDAVVVGSGLSGMTAAIVLAKHGLKTIVLEQAPRIGGLSQTFCRSNCSFPIGVHSVGSLAPGQILWRYFNYLGVLQQIRPVQMKHDAFLELRFPGFSMQVPHSHKLFQEKLLERCPKEQRAVQQYMVDMKKAVAEFSLYNLNAKAEIISQKLQFQSLENYLQSKSCSEKLSAILSSINPFYGAPPADCPLYMHFLVADSLLNSSWRIDETHCPLAEAFVKAFKQVSGETACNTLVEEIECKDGDVKAVHLTGGERIAAERVIFTGHPKQLPYLCSDKALRPAFRRRLLRAEETIGVFGIAIAWEDSACPMSLTDYIIYNSWQTGKHYQQKHLADKSELQMLYVSGSAEAVNGTYSVVALSTMLFEEMLPWQGTKPCNRPQSYICAKEVISDRMMRMVKKQWPDSSDRITLKASFSPLTFRDYTLAMGGGAYGIRKSVDKLYSGQITSATRVRGLFLAGQSVVLPGVLGTVISGIDACCVILGRQYLVNRIAKESE